MLRGFGVDVLDPETPSRSWKLPEAMAAIELHLQLAAQTPPGVETVQHDDNGRNLVKARSPCPTISGPIFSCWLSTRRFRKLSAIESGPSRHKAVSLQPI